MFHLRTIEGRRKERENFKTILCYGQNLAVSLTCDSKNFLLKIDMDGFLAVENNSVYLC